MNIIELCRKHRNKIFVSISSLLAVLLFCAFLLPLIVCPIAEKQITKNINRHVAIKKIGINPLTLTITIDSLCIKERDAEQVFVSLNRLSINLQLISLVKKGLILKTIQINNPYVNVCRYADSSYNFSDLIKPDTNKKSSGEFKFSLNNIMIDGGHIQIADMPKNSRHEIKNVKISVPFFSNLDYYTNVFCTPSFSAVVNGTLFELSGKTKPFDKSMETEIALKINKVDLAQYMEYLPQELNFKLKTALFSTDGHFTFKVKEDKKPFFEYSGLLALDSINVTDKKDSLVLALPSLTIDAQSAEVVSLSIHLNSVAIRHPAVNVTRERDGSISLINLIPKSQDTVAEKQKDNNGPSPLKLRVDKFSLEKARLNFVDNTLNKPFVHTIDTISVNVKDLSLDKGCEYAIDIVNRGTEKIITNGQLAFTPLAVKGKAVIQKLEPKAYSAYFPPDLNIEINSGFIDAESEYEYMMSNDTSEISLADGLVRIQDLSVWQRSMREEIFRDKNISLYGLNFNLNQKEISVDSLVTNGARLVLKRLPDGTINVANISNSPKKDKTIDSVKTVSDKTFLYQIKNIKVNDYRIAFEDQTTADTSKLLLDRINLTIANLSNQKKARSNIRFNAAMNTGGSLGVIGSLSMEPLNASLQIDFSNIPLKPAQSYLANQLNIALTGGSFNAEGYFGFSMDSKDALKAEYKGDVEINDFATINKESADNFLLLKTLKLKELNFALNPFSINIDEIGVSELYSLFNIYADGTTNLQTIMKKDSSGQNDSEQAQPQQQSFAAADTQKTPERKITIGTVLLDNCNVNFSDYRFNNIFHANMKDLNGKITRLSSEQDVVADVTVDGKYDGISPIVIAGKINPLAKNLYVDLGLNFNDIDLTVMNPYSQKYLGYGIRKGKLSLDLNYLVKDQKLDSKNNIFLDQLTLGEPVESPEATSLPVKFALALLRDQNGDIKLDVPITGSLDDPKFNIGKLLLQVLGNIITKAVTSPFTALSTLFGGSEELSYLEFNDGSDNLGSISLEKLNKLSKGLSQKEDLIVEIQGFVDSTKDREGLKKYFFERKLKTLKVKDLLRTSDKNVSIDSVTVLTEEYEKYLKKVYDSEKFAKPKNKLGFTKALTVPEMEKLIYTNITIKEDDLKMLASTRGMKTKEYLVNIKKVNTSRIYLVEASTLIPEVKPDVKNSRVEFKLKGQ